MQNTNKQKPYVFGQNSCPFSWEEMQTTNDPCRRFCSGCQKPVFDISRKNREEVNALVQAQGGSMCASGFTYQKSYFLPERWHQKLLRRAGVLGLLAALVLWGKEAKAQLSIDYTDFINEGYQASKLSLQSRTLGFTTTDYGTLAHLNKSYNDYEIAAAKTLVYVQRSAPTEEGTIFITGEVFLLKEALGHEPLSRVDVFLLRNGNREVARLRTNQQGYFSIEFSKKDLGESFSLRISDGEYTKVISGLDLVSTHVVVKLPNPSDPGLVPLPINPKPFLKESGK